MNLGGHCARCKAGVKALSPLAPSMASVDPVGGATPAMGTGQGGGAGGEANFGAPLPGAPNVGFRVPADPLDSNTRVRAEI